MANTFPRRVIAALLLFWTLGLAQVSTHALAEVLHHHDESHPCEQAQLIDDWACALPGTEPGLKTAPQRFTHCTWGRAAAPNALKLQTKNRDPPVVMR